MKKPVYLLIFSVLMVITVFAQPYKDEIADFKKIDSLSFPGKHLILFAGSSSFRKWTHVQEAFPTHPIINRGFGGSTLPDLIYYANDILFPYEAKQIVIYCGENDIAASDTLTAETVLLRVKQLFALIRSRQPKTEIDFVSIKPSPSRIQFTQTIEKANHLIEAFIAEQPSSKYINVFNAMLNPDGSIREDIFLEDRLHMNEKGYAIWTKIIGPYLKK
jgi:lysophospholipase L1-like esterase